MFGSRRLGPETMPLDQNVILLFFEYLIGSPDERGKWSDHGQRGGAARGVAPHRLERHRAIAIVLTNLGGMQAVMLTYTLGRIEK